MHPAAGRVQAGCRAETRQDESRSYPVFAPDRVSQFNDQSSARLVNGAADAHAEFAPLLTSC